MICLVIIKILLVATGLVAFFIRAPNFCFASLFWFVAKWAEGAFALLVFIDVALVARTGGIRLLLHALSEGPAELAPIISSAFLYIVDSPRTRAYLHPGTDLEVGRLHVPCRCTLIYG